MLDIKNLQQFVKLFEVGTVTGAAEKLHMSQPALTAHLNRLEYKLGNALFIRSSKGLEATPMGRDFYKQSKEMLRYWSVFDQKIKTLIGAEEGGLRIVCGAIIEQNILPNIITEVLRDYPNINIDVNVVNHQKMLASLHDGDADIAIGIFNDKDIFEYAFEKYHLKSQPINLYARPQHPFFNSNNSSQKKVDIKQFRLGTPKATKEIEKALIDLGFSPERALSSDSYQLLKGTAMQSDLIIAGPEFIFANELKKGSLLRLNIKSNINWQPSVLIAKPAQHSLLVKRFVEYVRATF